MLDVLPAGTSLLECTQAAAQISMEAPDKSACPEASHLPSPEACQWLGLDLEELLHPNGKPVKGGRARRVMTSVFNFLSDPTISTSARLLSAAMFLVILLSTIAFVLGTLDSLNNANPSAFDTIELICVVIFTIDYGLRFITCPYSRLRFAFQPLNIIDLVSILPWYISLALQDSSVSSTSVFRVLRLLRVLKIVNRQSGISVIAATLVKSWDMMLLVCFFVVLLLIAVSTCMFMLERGDWDDQLGYYVRPNENRIGTDDAGNSFPMASPFTSVPEGFWWAIVTMLTVGYGDVVPTTPGGKALAMLTMLLGITTLALPIGMIGSTFTSLWSEYQGSGGADRKCLPEGLQELDAACSEHITSLDDLVNLFSMTDRQVEDVRSKLAGKLEAFHLEHQVNMIQSFSHSRVRSMLQARPVAEGVSEDGSFPTPTPAAAAADLTDDTLHVTELEGDHQGQPEGNPSLTGYPGSMKREGEQLAGDRTSPERASSIAPLPPIRSSRSSLPSDSSSLRTSKRMFGDVMDVAAEARIKQLLNSIHPDEAESDLRAVSQLHSELKERADYLNKLIKASRLLTCKDFPGDVSSARVTLAQIMTQQQAEKDTQAKIHQAETDVTQLEALAQSLQQSLHGSAPSSLAGALPAGAQSHTASLTLLGSISAVFQRTKTSPRVAPQQLAGDTIPSTSFSITGRKVYSQLHMIAKELAQAQAVGNAPAVVAALRAELKARRQQ